VQLDQTLFTVNAVTVELHDDMLYRHTTVLEHFRTDEELETAMAGKACLHILRTHVRAPVTRDTTIAN
jgi:hypothetical protein